MYLVEQASRRDGCLKGEFHHSVCRNRCENKRCSLVRIAGLVVADDARPGTGSTYDTAVVLVEGKQRERRERRERERGERER